MKKIFFTPGPSQLYFTVEEHLKSALKENIATVSHRGEQFKNLYKHADEGLRMLLGIPSNFSIIFTSSATEIWERVIQNCVIDSSLHFVNGAFSRKFYDTAIQLGINAQKIVAQDGTCTSTEEITLSHSPELISFTHNETSTGASQPLEDIYSARKKFPDALISVDAVSSLPYVNLDYSKVDSVYFSVQKCFGLPAGLGVWLVNDRCKEAASKKEALNKLTGATFRLTNSIEMAKNSQTVATPNVLGIYLLGKVVEDMNLKGIDMIRRETEYKAAVLYHAIKEHPLLSPFVKNSKYQSKTVVVAEANDSDLIIEKMAKKGFVLGSGYGNYKNKHIRIANFPTHSKEQIEMVADRLLEL